MKRLVTLLAAAVFAAMLLPASVIAQPAGTAMQAAQPDHAVKKVTGKPAGKSSRNANKRRWNGYGFLPGYRQPPALTDWRDRSRRFTGRYDRSGRYEQRYVRYYGWSPYGQLQYGWGGPGIYRGQWNGGSFGPCWTDTPIGMVWNCGQ